MAQSSVSTSNAMTELPDSNIERAVINVPAPRSAPSIWVTGGRGGEREIKIDPGRREQHRIYYEMFRQHPTVRAAVEKIAKMAVANGYRFVPATYGGKVSPRKRNALSKFFRDSNAGQLLRATYKDLLIYGESFWLIVGAKAGRPQRAMRLHADSMDPIVKGGVLTGWRYGPVVSGITNEIEYLDKEIVHFMFDDPASDTRGLSLLESLQHTVAGDLFTMNYNTKFFENAAASGTIFTMKNATKEEVDRNRDWLEQNYVGTDNAHRPMVLEGDIGVQKSVTTRQEMQFIEGRKFNRQEILSTLDIDPSKMGISDSANRSIAKEADNSFRSESIGSLQTIAEEEISNSIIRGMFGWDDVLFEQEESSMRDKLDLIRLFAAGERMGVFAVNDILDELGRPRVEGGEVHFIQTSAGLLPLDMIQTVAERLVLGEPAAASGVGTGSPFGDEALDDEEPKADSEDDNLD